MKEVCFKQSTPRFCLVFVYYYFIIVVTTIVSNTITCCTQYTCSRKMYYQPYLLCNTISTCVVFAQTNKQLETLDVNSVDDPCRDAKHTCDEFHHVFITQPRLPEQLTAPM